MASILSRVTDGHFVWIDNSWSFGIDVFVAFLQSHLPKRILKLYILHSGCENIEPFKNTEKSVEFLDLERISTFNSTSQAKQDLISFISDPNLLSQMKQQSAALVILSTSVIELIDAQSSWMSQFFNHLYNVYDGTGINIIAVMGHECISSRNRISVSRIFGVSFMANSSGSYTDRWNDDFRVTVEYNSKSGSHKSSTFLVNRSNTNHLNYDFILLDSSKITNFPSTTEKTKNVNDSSKQHRSSLSNLKLPYELTDEAKKRVLQKENETRSKGIIYYEYEKCDDVDEEDPDADLDL